MKTKTVVEQIIPAAAGWVAVTHDGKGGLYVDPIPCFALLKRIDEPPAWHEVVPVLRLESDHFGIPFDNYTRAEHEWPDLILGPGDDPDADWVRERVIPKGNQL